jgi:hypothetical protein
MVAAVLSVFLALQSEGLADQYGFTTGTPGEIVSRMVVPASGLDSLGKSMTVPLAVDAPIWFVVICGSAVIVTTVRRRGRQKSLSRTN